MRIKIHWGLKTLISLAMLMSVYGMQTGAEKIVEGNEILGYPDYLLTILSVAYVVGVLAIWQQKFPLFQEWGYAGLTIALLGAIVSHLLAPSGFQHALPACLLLAVLLGAYFTRAQQPKN